MMSLTEILIKCNVVKYFLQRSTQRNEEQKYKNNIYLEFLL